MCYHIIWIYADDSVQCICGTLGPRRSPLWTCAADSDDRQESCGKKKVSMHWGCVWKTERIDFHADGWIDQVLLLFLLKSLCTHKGQGQSNSHQLFWFFTGIVSLVGEDFILIRETNGRGHVGGVLGEKSCSNKQQVDGKAGQKIRNKE